MNAPSHLAVCLAPLVALAPRLSGDISAGDPGLLLVGAAVAGMASLLPDADNRWPLKLVLSHRGPLHSLGPGLLLAGLVALCLGPSAGLLALWGHVSHLLGDACTSSGIRPLYPLRVWIRLLPWPLCFPTGSRREWLAVALWAALWAGVALVTG